MLLKGLRVLELGDGVAGGVAAAILADLGAAVSKLPTGVTYRPDTPSPSSELLMMRELDFKKRFISDGSIDPNTTWHLVINDCVASPAGWSHPQLIRDTASRQTVVTISAFGQGPYCDWRGSEFVALASGGALSVSKGPKGEPIPLAGWQGLLSAGYVAALAALHGLSVRKTSTGPVAVDVSVRDAVIFNCIYPECAHGLLKCPGQAGSGRYTAPSGLFEAKNGRVRLAAIDEHQWEGARRAIGDPPWASALKTVAERREHAEEINQAIEAWTRTRLKTVAAAEMQKQGVPATPVNSIGDVLKDPHLKSRSFFSDNNGQDGAPPTHRAPYLLKIADAQAAGCDESFWDEGRGRSLSDIRMVEATHVLAAPIGGALLGGMGVQVIRLEDLDRLDLYRRSGPFADGHAGQERGAYFLAANANKDSLAFSEEKLDLVHQAVSECDILLENVGSRRLSRWKLDMAKIRGQGKLTVSVSGFGRTGPLTAYRAYANNIHAYSGLTDSTRTANGETASITSILADPATALVAAIVISAWSIGPFAGIPADADIAMLEVMVARLGDHLAARRIGVPINPRSRERECNALLNEVFETLDGESVALTVRDEREWRALCELLSTDPNRGSDRLNRYRVAKSGIGRQTAAAVVRELQKRGVAAAVAAQPKDLWEDDQLRRRHLFQRVQHDELGEYWTLAQPWRIEGEGNDTSWRGAPTLGNWNKTAG